MQLRDSLSSLRSLPLALSAFSITALGPRLALAAGLEDVVPDAIKPYFDLATDIVTAIVIFIIGNIVAGWVSGLVRRALTKRQLDESLVGFLGSLARWLVLAAAVIAALEAVGVQTTSLVALLGSAGLAIGLALQGNLAHFASGVMILIFKPYSVDHYVATAGHEGWIKEIGLFTTTMLTVDNETVIIPNGVATGGSLINYSKAGTRRAHVAVGVAYGSKVPQVIEVLTKAAKDSKFVDQSIEPVIAFVGLGASSIDFLILAHCQPADYADMLHTVRTNAYEGLEAAGIEIPFDQLVLHKAPEG